MENNIEQKLNKIMEYSLLSAKNVLTLDDTALLTGLSKSFLYKLTCTHQIPYYKPNGKQVYFDRKEIEAWMKRNRHQTTDDVVRLKKYRIFVQNKTQTREIKGIFCYQFVTRTFFGWG